MPVSQKKMSFNPNFRYVLIIPLALLYHSGEKEWWKLRFLKQLFLSVRQPKWILPHVPLLKEYNLKRDKGNLIW